MHHRPSHSPPRRRRPSLPIVVVLLVAVLGWASVALPVAAAIAGARTQAAATGGETVLVRPERAVDARPTGEQRLRLAGPTSEPPSLDPAKIRDAGSAFLVRQLFAGLTRFGDDLVPVPDLAERIVVAADGLTYSFALDPDAAFADGSPITAEVVVASLERTLRPDADAAPGAPSGLAALTDIEGAADLALGRSADLPGARVLDERTLELRLVSPRATFLMKLATAQATIVDPRDPPRGEEAGEEWWRAPNASGPFRVEVWDAGERLLLVPNERYAGGRAMLDQVDIRVGPEAAQAENLYQAGDIDLVTVPGGAIDRVLDAAEGTPAEVIETPLFSTEFLVLAPAVPPLDDVHVRRAIVAAFPRDRVPAVTFGGHKAPARGLVPTGMLGREWPPVVPPYDLGRARAELAASRYGSAAAVPPIRIHAMNPFGAAALRDVLRRDLGLRIEVVAVEPDDFLAGLGQTDFPAHGLGWIADYPDPETFLWSLFGSTSPDNYAGYRNDAFDAVMMQAAATLDDGERGRLYDRAERLLFDEAVVLPLFHDVRYTLVRPEVKGVVVTPLGLLALDRVWIER